MRTEERTSVKNSIGRLVFVTLSVIMQVIWICVLVIRLNRYSVGISLFSSIASFLIVLRLYGTHTNAAYKMPWIMLIMAFPIMGLCLYLMLGYPGITRGMRRRFENIDSGLLGRLYQDEQVQEQMQKSSLNAANQSGYIWKHGGYPVYQNTEVSFYRDTIRGLEEQKKELLRAEHFIFMEYHAIEDAEAFGGIRKILAEKAAEGVEVLVIYDDIGSIGFINPDFISRMEADGIACRVFNPLIPFLNVFMNHRDHRKITVIDGQVGFTGGYNLADEYFNITHPYGQWKDSGLKLTGDAVTSLTVMFLEMWNAIQMTDSDYDKYLSAACRTGDSMTVPAKMQCFVQPYADSPLDDELVGENVYMNLVRSAETYVYFTTPYLIISDEFGRELELAAKRGVDVRIVTPGIPDKAVVYKLTRSYYAGLVRTGVRIYEYTPGFLHAKQCICDGRLAVCGTINLDYRSLYLHFENGVLLYNCDAIKDMRRDFDELFEASREVTKNYQSKRSTMLRMGECILRLFAPLM